MTITAISDAELMKVLKDHFFSFYQLIANAKLVPEASFEETDNLLRCLTGTPFFLFNGILDSSELRGDYDRCIDDQKKYFAKAKLPFVWFVEEGTNPELESSLQRKGFTSPGIFRGIASNLNQLLLPPPQKLSYAIEVISDGKMLDKFGNFLGASFGMDEKTTGMLKRVLALDALKGRPRFKHWVALKNGEIVSSISSLVKEKNVSIWNGATSEQFRRQGICTALAHELLEDAMKRGCHIATSYLMSDAQAFGISTKLGFQTKWRLKAYISPQK